MLRAAEQARRPQHPAVEEPASSRRQNCRYCRVETCVGRAGIKPGFHREFFTRSVIYLGRRWPAENGRVCADVTIAIVFSTLPPIVLFASFGLPDSLHKMHDGLRAGKGDGGSKRTCVDGLWPRSGAPRLTRQNRTLLGHFLCGGALMCRRFAAERGRVTTPR